MWNEKKFKRNLKAVEELMEPEVVVNLKTIASSCSLKGILTAILYQRSKSKDDTSLALEWLWRRTAGSKLKIM